jgi:hypothetical protein
MDIRLNPDSYRMLRETALKFPVAGSRALNRLSRMVRTEASREIRKDYNLKKSEVDKTMTILPAAKDRLYVRILARAARIKLYAFGARQNKPAPATVVVKRGRRHTLRHTFIAKMKSGHVGVFLRKNKKDVNKKKHGLPIRELTGPSPADLFGSSHMRRHLDNFVSLEFPKLLLQNIKHVLGRTGE